MTDSQELQRIPEVVAVVPASGDAVLDMIAAAARDPAVDPAKLAALFDLKSQIESRAAKILFSHAFARLMQRLPRVKKNGTITLRRDGVDKGSIPFATWEDVDAAIRTILGDEGFSLSFPTTLLDGGGMKMVCKLTHVAGHCEMSESLVKPDEGPGRNSTQAVGSGRSYTKRYLALDMLNIVTEGKDDDGRAAGFISDEQCMIIETMVKDAGVSAVALKQCLAIAGVDSIRTIQQRSYTGIVEALKAKKRQKEGA